jgi:uncharacterized repeat protein (TIGR03803 family)
MRFARQSSYSSTRCAATLVAAMVFVLTLATAAFATTHEKTLYSFTGSPDASPNGALVADAAGNLYGTTPSSGSGTVFELSPPATSGGAWTETVLYAFQGGDTDGAYPYGTLIFDNAGNLYGTTSGGGPDNRGTVFELSPPATSGGAWTETVLFFLPTNLFKGYSPAGRLAFDGEGNLYGMAQNGGIHFHTCDCGTLFELTPPAVSGGAWTPHVLHNFGLTTGDGANPVGDLTYWKGALYGMTAHGGTSGAGTIFQATRSHGTWTVSVLASFDGINGSLPFGALALDAAGNAYGVAVNGGFAGTVYELSSPAVTGSGWQLSALYAFTGAKDGANPSGPVVLDSAGNIYGTARNGGLRNSQTNNNGTVFELSPPATSGGAWTETTLHEFGGGVYNDGSQPNYGVVVVNGKLYGTTAAGGLNNVGTVFSLAVN